MASIIAITNQKGGVGKTTTAAAVMSALVQRRQRVLGVDLDPQGSLGFSLGMDIERNPTVFDVLTGQTPVEEAVIRTDNGDILTSNILLSAAEREFNRAGREFLLRNALSRIQDRYDYIIIDTPPALNVLTINAYVAADALIIPMVPEILSLLGVAQIRETIETVRQSHNSKLKVLGILLNKYNARLTLNQEVMEMSEQIARQLGTKVFQTTIHSGIAVAEAPAHGESVITYSPRSKPSLDFQSLVTEITGMEAPKGIMRRR